jgi:hypothetical protein
MCALLVPEGFDEQEPFSEILLYYFIIFLFIILFQKFMETISLNKKLREERIHYFPLIPIGHTESDTIDNSIVAGVLITTVTFLPSCC